jgi:very-short-patch-repair endonuclease
LPYDKNLIAHARANRKNPTPAETLIWNRILRHRQFQHYKFLRQKPIGRYIVDFYCAELRLVIEIDGDSHAQQADYDETRTRDLTDLGLSVVRYTNPDVLHNLEGVFDDFMRRVGSLAPSPDKGRAGEGFDSGSNCENAKPKPTPSPSLIREGSRVEAVSSFVREGRVEAVSSFVREAFPPSPEHIQPQFPG